MWEEEVHRCVQSVVQAYYSKDDPIPKKSKKIKEKEKPKKKALYSEISLESK